MTDEEKVLSLEKFEAFCMAFTLLKIGVKVFSKIILDNETK